MSSTQSSLPCRIVDLVAESRNRQHGPKRITRAVQKLLKIALHPICCAMQSSRIISVRKNTRALKALYTGRELASLTFQAAYYGSKDHSARLEKISALLKERFEHVLGILRTLMGRLHDRLMGMTSTGLPPRQTAPTLFTEVYARSKFPQPPRKMLVPLDLCHEEG